MPLALGDVLALATDYDETIAHHGEVPEKVLRAFERFRDSGRKLILDTGRGLADLLASFPEPERFDLLVLEGGALLYDPVTREERVLTPPPPAAFLDDLRQRGVFFAERRVIVDTLAIHKHGILDAIRAAGLDMHLVFNKESIMVLPEGVDKASGLRAALERWQIPVERTATIGDAENDHALLDCTPFRFAVPNAIPALAAKAVKLISVPDLIDEILAKK